MTTFLAMMKGAKPEVRLCAWLILRSYYLELPFSFSVTFKSSIISLSKKLGVSVDLASATINYLSNASLFKKVVSKEVPKVGRPTPEFEISTEFLSSFDIHLESRNSLVSEILDIKSKRLGTHGDLKLGNRLLLIVLLLHADQYGCVNSLGFNKISLLTGMSRDQFFSQLTKLQSTQYVMSVLPGVTSKYILGARPSVYFLDVTKNKFISSKLQSLVCESCSSLQVYQKFSSLCFEAQKYLVAVLQSKEEFDDSRKRNAASFLKESLVRMDKLTKVKNVEKCLRIFMEAKLRKNLRSYIVQLIYFYAVSMAFDESSLNDEQLDDACIDELVANVVAVLKPTFQFKGQNELKDSQYKVHKSESEEDEHKDEELMNTWDLTIFAEVLLKVFILPLAMELRKCIECVKEFNNKNRPLYGFVCSVSEINTLPSFRVFFPVSIDLKYTRTRLVRGKLEVIEDPSLEGI
ncbi:hypothetical protein CF168_06045 [Shewanella bicestrii]|uniref:Uncharacterized protein n=1 Tax=Shewanella bicestrii TaxID=2018305 RepID=A0A220UJW1_9GAMM|nr:hypothetical protein [Shewanella bicestrii]ASK68467.1 hypothetical protein CF168_06045 [Shewanella bicestrii]